MRVSIDRKLMSHLLYLRPIEYTLIVFKEDTTVIEDLQNYQQLGQFLHVLTSHDVLDTKSSEGAGK